MYYIAKVVNIQQKKDHTMIDVYVEDLQREMKGVAIVNLGGYSYKPTKDDVVAVFIPKGDEDFAFCIGKLFFDDKQDVSLKTTKFTSKSTKTTIIEAEEEIRIKSSKKVIIEAPAVEIGGATAEALNKQAQLVIPAGSVVISVSGGSGAPAVGTPNPSDIPIKIVNAGQTKTKV